MISLFNVMPNALNAFTRHRVYRKGKRMLSVISTWPRCVLIVDTIPRAQTNVDTKVTEFADVKFYKNENDCDTEIKIPDTFSKAERSRLEKDFKANPYCLHGDGWDLGETTYYLHGDFETKSVTAHTVTLFTSEVELVYKPLSKKQFKDYAENGMPQSEFDDSIAESDPIFDELTMLTIDGAEVPDFQSRFKAKYDLAVRVAQADKRDAREATKSQNVAYAVIGESWIKRSWYDLTIYEDFDFSKVDVSVSRFHIFGTGVHRDFFTITYDGFEFEFRENLGANYSEYFLIDSKGNKTDLNLFDDDDDDDDDDD